MWLFSYIYLLYVMTYIFYFTIGEKKNKGEKAQESI